MNSSPWLTLKQASDAAANGQPGEAHRLLAPVLEAGYRKAWRVARDVAKAYCKRATKSLDRDNAADAAWRDLLAAESLNTGEKCVADLRVTLTRLGLVQGRAALEAGSPMIAVDGIARLRDRGVFHPDLRQVEEAAQDWILAAEKADRGEFLSALDDLARLRSRLPCPVTGLDKFRSEIESRHNRFRDAVGRAQEAAEGKQWRLALAAAESALAAAPEHREARTLRTKAWQAAYPESAAKEKPAPPIPQTIINVAPQPRSVHATKRETSGGGGMRSSRPETADLIAGFTGRGSPPSDGSSEVSHLPRRFLLWVDGVAGYLVCTGSRVAFGQAVLEGGPVDVPLFADVSRVHADVTRDGEGYVIDSGGKETQRPVYVNGKAASRAVLASGDRVTLGSTCQFIFQKPISVSSTARLELTSGHRLMLPVEGVLLMANEIIIGPGPQSHVNVPDLSGRVILYRSKEGLGVRYADGKFTINDQSCAERTTLTLPASFECSTLTFTVEAVGPRLG